MTAPEAPHCRCRCGHDHAAHGRGAPFRCTAPHPDPDEAAIGYLCPCEAWAPVLAT